MSLLLALTAAGTGLLGDNTAQIGVSETGVITQIPPLTGAASVQVGISGNGTIATDNFLAGDDSGQTSLSSDGILVVPITLDTATCIQTSVSEASVIVQVQMLFSDTSIQGNLLSISNIDILTPLTGGTSTEINTCSDAATGTEHVLQTNNSVQISLSDTGLVEEIHVLISDANIQISLSSALPVDQAVPLEFGTNVQTPTLGTGILTQLMVLQQGYGSINRNYSPSDEVIQDGVLLGYAPFIDCRQLNESTGGAIKTEGNLLGQSNYEINLSSATPILVIHILTRTTGVQNATSSENAIVVTIVTPPKNAAAYTAYVPTDKYANGNGLQIFVPD